MVNKVYFTTHTHTLALGLHKIKECHKQVVPLTLFFEAIIKKFNCKYLRINKEEAYSIEKKSETEKNIKK